VIDFMGLYYFIAISKKLLGLNALGIETDSPEVKKSNFCWCLRATLEA
jgi:hypothetical protein